MNEDHDRPPGPATATPEERKETGGKPGFLKRLFGRKGAPANLQTRTIGFYSKGCLAGAVALPINGATWQVMRLSRNRNWGHPNLVQFLERLAAQAPKTGWHGLLVGDMSQPRGGPMFTGHASHQVGLDADIWLTPMPNRQLSRNEREEMSAVMMVRNDRLDVDTKVFTPGHLAIIRAAALEPSVQRIFVNAAIKKALCREAKGDRSWLSKIRPWFGHDYHFHVRMRCPPGATDCHGQKDQDPPREPNLAKFPGSHHGIHALFFHEPEYVFVHDHGVIDDNTDREDQSQHRNVVQSEAHDVHEQKRRHNGCRNG